MNGKTNRGGEVGVIVYISQGNTSDKDNERGSQIPKQLSDGRWIRTFLYDSSKQNYIYLVKAACKSIWA